ncbi:hypothetical protein NDU88_002970 [Pleurodeles waltl]|uniref:Uncharacterized protein n=1 Tax=Pleurodeles waltl TaxID=8319 RepID=A0AAV7SEH8_PLEWA|nr:hypothetical protein NDU88_002970 [Pleurodeles waltl]
MYQRRLYGRASIRSETGQRKERQFHPTQRGEKVISSTRPRRQVRPAPVTARFRLSTFCGGSRSGSRESGAAGVRLPGLLPSGP